jgi:hypothetical protein
MRVNLEVRLEIYRMLRALLSLWWGASGGVGADLMRARSANLVAAHLALDEATR